MIVAYVKVLRRIHRRIPYQHPASLRVPESTLIHSTSSGTAILSSPEKDQKPPIIHLYHIIRASSISLPPGQKLTPQNHTQEHERSQGPNQTFWLSRKRGEKEEEEQKVLRWIQTHKTTQRRIKCQRKTSFRTLMNAPAPPSSLISFTRTSVCWYSRSRAAEDDFPSDTIQISESHVERGECRNTPKMAEFNSSATATRPAGSR